MNCNTVDNLRIRNPSNSALSTMSFSSSSSSSTNSYSNSNDIGKQLDDQAYRDIVIVYPNGFQAIKKIESTKAIYDLLIELSAGAKLIPTNYTLMLYNHDSNVIDCNKDENASKLIEYTPNQTIGQLNPEKIIILPKTTTLKHQQLQLLSPISLNIPLDMKHNISQEMVHRNRFKKSPNFSSSNMHLNKSSTIDLSKFPLNSYNQNFSQQPFELTIRVEVNLPFNQKTTVRVKPDIIINDLFNVICKEANLQKDNYKLVIATKDDRKISMDDSFALYDTKEVNVIFKNNENPSNKMKNSSVSNTSFVQNSLKPKQSKRIYNQTSQLKAERINNNRSKSEVDLTFSNSKTTTLKEESIKEKDEIKKKSSKSFTLMPLSNSMFGFFTRKKCNASPKTATERKDNMINEIPKKDNANENSLTNANKRKKRLAPLPPVQVLQTNHVTNEVINKVPLQTRDSTLVIGNSNHDLELDPVKMLKILTKKKKKNAPPPPPQSQSPKHTNINENEQLRTNLEMDHDESKSVAKKDSNSEENYRADNNEVNRSIGSSQFEFSELNVSSSLNYNKTKSLSSLHISDSRFLSDFKCDSSVSKTQNEDEQFKNDSFKSNSSFKLNLENLEMNKQIFYSKAIVKKCSSFESFYEKICIMNEADSKKKGSSAPKIDDFSLTYMGVINYKKDTEASDPVPDEDFFASEVKAHSLQDNSSEIETSLILAKQSSIEKLNIPENINNSNQPVDISPKCLDNELTIEQLHVAENDNSLSTNFNDYTEKRIAITETGPLFLFSTLISNYNGVSENVNMDLNGNSTYQDENNESSLSKLVIKTNYDSYENEETKESANDDQIKLKKTNTSFLRSLSSPPPQFPAIAENEINELHPNYTVVRSGQIIEKNGTYYSNDGTIRGFSGTVRKMANSKQLNDVFVKKQSKETIREVDNTVEKELRKENVNTINKSDSKIAEPIIISEKTTDNKTQYNKHMFISSNITPNLKTISEKRLSLNEVIANEKKAKNNINPSTLSSNSNIFKKTCINEPHNLIRDSFNNSMQSITKNSTNQNDNRNINDSSSDTSQLEIDIIIKPPDDINKICSSNHTDSSKVSSSGSDSENSFIKSKTFFKSKLTFSPEKSNENKKAEKRDESIFVNQSFTKNNDFSQIKLKKTNFDRTNQMSDEFGNQQKTVQNELKQKTNFSDENCNFSFQKRNITNIYTKNLTENSSQNRFEVVNVQLNAENSNKNVDSINLNTNLLMKVPAIETLNDNKTNVTNRKIPPMVASKNFTNDALNCLNKKNQVLNNRDNLMDSIKSFNVSNLRKVNK